MCELRYRDESCEMASHEHTHARSQAIECVGPAKSALSFCSQRTL